MTFMEKKIKKFLKEKGINYEEFDHEPVYTCEVAKKVVEMIPNSTGIKNLLLESTEGKFVIALCPGDKKIKTSKLAKLEGTKELRLAKPKDVERLVGCPIGCVPPFGYKRQIKTYLDKELLESEYLYFNPGNHSKTIKIQSKDLLKLIEKPILYE